MIEAQAWGTAGPRSNRVILDEPLAFSKHLWAGAPMALARRVVKLIGWALVAGVESSLLILRSSPGASVPSMLLRPMLTLGRLPRPAFL